MTDSPTPQSSEPAKLRNQVAIIFANLLFSDKSLHRIAKTSKDELEKAESAIDDIMQLFEAELARQTTAAELHGRNHENIEAFQNGQLSVSYYSKRSDELSEKISNTHPPEEPSK